MSYVYDVVIVGGGIAGTSIARELSQYQLKIALIEKEADVSFGSSKASTAIIHPGIPIEGAPLKSETLITGNLMFPRLCKELDVPFKRVGELTIVTKKEDVKILEETKEKGISNGVQGLEIIGKEKIFQLEPNITKKAIAALWAPTAGLVNPFEIVMALAENAKQNGVNIFLNTEVVNIFKEDSSFTLKVSSGFSIMSKFVINAAGLFADKVASMVGADDFSISPYKGEEIIFDKKVGYLLNRPVFPPTPWVLVMPTVEGNIMAGTSYEQAERKDDLATTFKSCRRILSNAKKLIPALSEKDIIRSFAGLRAMNTRTSDYIIESSNKIPEFINVVLGTPGITSAPAIAKKVSQILANQGLKLVKKSNFNPYRQRISRFAESSDSEKMKMFSTDKLYGHVVCRCETVTEGEIVEAIKRGAKTLDGIKYRTRAGMGRCQGGFCSPRVVKILARELKIPVTEVTKKGDDSRILLFKSKELLEKERKDEPSRS